MGAVVETWHKRHLLIFGMHRFISSYHRMLSWSFLLHGVGSWTSSQDRHFRLRRILPNYPSPVRKIVFVSFVDYYLVSEHFVTSLTLCFCSILRRGKKEVLEKEIILERKPYDTQPCLSLTFAVPGIRKLVPDR